MHRHQQAHIEQEREKEIANGRIKTYVEKCKHRYCERRREATDTQRNVQSFFFVFLSFFSVHTTYVQCTLHSRLYWFSFIFDLVVVFFLLYCLFELILSLFSISVSFPCTQPHTCISTHEAYTDARMYCYWCLFFWIILFFDEIDTCM